MVSLKKICNIFVCVSLLCVGVSASYADADDGSGLVRNNRVMQNAQIDIDYTEGFTLAKPAGQIVIGNPLVADIKVQDDKNIFIIGKSPGRTNMLVYGRDGTLQARHTIFVRDPNTYLTVYSGAGNKLHYDCLPLCQRVVRIEDTGPGYEEQSAKVTSSIDRIEQRADKSTTQDAAAGQVQ
jgi:hypothetical protein